jgi:putative tryptophan/tyrosine transport system substrate-binding protein
MAVGRTQDRQMSRTFTGCLALVAALLLLPGVGAAQPKGPIRVGVLLYTAKPAPGQASSLVDAFRSGLRDLGYVEGQNIQLEYRWADGSSQRAAEHAAELAKSNVSAMVTAGTPATLAAKAATTTIPIVMTAVGDPVASGIVATLAQPGGNVTGLSLLDSALDSKRIELLKLAAPGLTRVAMLWSPDDPGMALAFSRVEIASHDLRLNLQSMAVHSAGDLSGVAQAASSGRAEAIFVTAQPFTTRHMVQILEVVDRLKLPAMYTDRRFVDAGGLMAYGPSLADAYRRAATYVDRILRGARPSDLPVEQPITFELVVNLRAARALGLTLPPALMARVDQFVD